MPANNVQMAEFMNSIHKIMYQFERDGNFTQLNFDEQITVTLANVHEAETVLVLVKMNDNVLERYMVHYPLKDFGKNDSKYQMLF